MENLLNPLNHRLIPIQLPAFFTPLKVEGYLDTKKEDIICGESFLDLIHEKLKEKMDYVLALIQDIGSSHLHFFDAENLNKWTIKKWSNPRTNSEKCIIYQFKITDFNSVFRYIGKLEQNKVLDKAVIHANLRNTNYMKLDAQCDLLKLKPLKSSLFIDLNSNVERLPISEKKQTVTEMFYRKKEKHLPYVFAAVQDVASCNYSYFDGMDFFHWNLEFDVSPTTKNKINHVFYVNITTNPVNNKQLCLNYLGEPKDANKLFLNAFLNASKGNMHAAHMLGIYYMDGMGVEENFKEAVKWFRLAGNHPDTQFDLGSCYNEGKGVKKDYKKAIQLFENAAQHEHTKSIYKLGLNYFDGKGVEQDNLKGCAYILLASLQGHIDAKEVIDKEWEKLPITKQSAAYCHIGLFYHKWEIANKTAPEKSIKYWKIAGEMGCLSAQYLLGKFYAREEYLDINEMMNWLTLAAMNNHMESQYSLGMFYLTAGTYKCHEMAAHWFLMASKLGHTDAYYELGMLYDQGQGVFKNFDNAVTCMKIASEKGHAAAQYKLACYHLLGVSVNLDLKESLRLLTLSANQDHVDAQYNLGHHYSQQKDFKQASKWWTPIANKGHQNAQYNLGLLYNNQKNYKETFKWWLLAAEQGHPTAQYNVASCYDKGLGVKKDTKETIKWWKKAAKQNYVLAQYNLGVCYANGLRVKRDEKKAVKWFTLAAKNGDHNAEVNLAMLYMDGIGVMQNIQESVTLIKSAAASGNPEAQFILGGLHNSGIGVEANVKESIRLWELSAKQGHEKAMQALKLYYTNIIQNNKK